MFKAAEGFWFYFEIRSKYFLWHTLQHVWVIIHVA